MKHEFKNYQLNILPIGSAYYEMSPKEAKENFDHFIKIIPERTDYLINRCADDLNVSVRTFDFSPESLILIWRWFLQNAGVVKLSKSEFNDLQKAFSHLGNAFIGEKRLSATTEFVLCDVGMYFGEIFVKNRTSIQWGLCTAPKKSLFFNHPILKGLVDHNYTPPFYPIFPPIHMVGVQAAKLLSNETNEEDLYHLFQWWDKYTHN